MNAERRETAVIIIPDSVTEDDPDGFEGYIGEDAGGHRVTFGRHNRCLLNDIPEDYMVYVKREFAKTARSRGMPVFTAVEKYTAWLLQYAEQNYKEFIVPFGKKHFGQKIAQCRDKNWFRWILKQPILRRKFPIFCAAVMEHLRNPIHQEVHRDIGELLSATQYADDIELMVYNRKERKELARNVWIAVSDDSDSDDVDSGSGSDDSTVSRVSGEEGEEEDSEDSKASASDFDAYDSDFIDDADADLDDDHPDMDDKTYFNWLQTHITQSDLLANLGSTYRVGRTGTFPNWQPKSSPAGDTTSDTDLTESDTRSDTTISDPEVAEDATETSSVTETTSVQDSTPPPTTRRKTLSKRKHLISEEDNNGIENDGSSQFDERSYEPSQEPSDEEGNNIEISQRKTRSMTKAVAKLASPSSSKKRTNTTTSTVSQETDDSDNVKGTRRRRAQEISASSSDDSRQARPKRPNTPTSTPRVSRKRNIVSSSGSDSVSASPTTPKRVTKRPRRVSSTNVLDTDSPFTSPTNTPIRDIQTLNNSQSSSTTEEGQPRQPPGSKANFRVISPSSDDGSQPANEGQRRSARRRRSVYRAPSSDNDSSA